MIWNKKNKIYTPKYDGSWMDNTALTPTPFLLNQDTIRIFVSFRDPSGIGRLGYVDVEAENPSKVIRISSNPVLDIGSPGAFDDNGMILGDIVRYKDDLLLYYVGFQLATKCKFLAFTGLAISKDKGQTFSRHSEVPIYDRYDGGKYIVAIHSIFVENKIFRCWYATCNGWTEINGQSYPKYDISYCESNDGINFNSGTRCITCDEQNGEYRIGRPRVFKYDNKYIMYFTYGTKDGRYQAGQAISDDGITWLRNDEELTLMPSNQGWDSKHISYPSYICSPLGKQYLFYNGNDHGVDGFGYAQLL